MKQAINCRFLFSILAVAACGTSASQPSSGDAGTAASARPADAVGPADAANAAVPAIWKSKLAFVTLEAGLSDKSKVTVPVPGGWKARAENWAVGHFQPSQPPSSDWDGSTDLYVGYDCNGGCEPKKAAEWATSADKMFAMVFDPALSPKTIKDEKVEGRRTVIASMAGHTTIMTTWWKEGGDRYHQCAAVLPDKDSELIPAFEQACLAARAQ